MTPAVEVRDLSHRYGKATALDSVSLSLPAARIHALLGRNGSGKSTLLRILATAQRLQTGSARVLGHDVASAATEVRRRIAVVFQSPAIDDLLSVSENLRCHAALFGISTRDYHDRSTALLNALELHDRQRARVSTLSGGMRRRVELVKALLSEPELLLMDEPTSGLDADSRRQLWGLLRELQERRGMTVLMSTHLLDDAERCDGVVLLEQGEVLRQQSSEELRRDAQRQVLRARLTAQAVQSARTALTDAGLTGVVEGDELTVHERASEAAEIILRSFASDIRWLQLREPTLDELVTR